jgi:CBS domain-containing protein
MIRSPPLRRIACILTVVLFRSIPFITSHAQVLVAEVLKAKHSYRWVEPVVNRTATVKEAITIAIEGGLSGMMVLEEDNHHCVGLITSRDLLRIMAASIKDGETNDQLMEKTVGDFMTPISQVIYGRPDETVGMCRTVMAKLGIKCLPILSREGRVEGLLTARDMSDFGLSASDKGGKKSYLNDVAERVGLSSNTSMAEPPTFLKAHLALEQSPLYINLGISALPHPFKTENGVGRNHRGKTDGLPGTGATIADETIVPVYSHLVVMFPYLVR